MRRSSRGWYATLKMVTLSQLRARVQNAGRAERLRLLGRILREARDSETVTLPAGVAPAELREYLRGLIDRLMRLAHP